MNSNCFSSIFIFGKSTFINNFLSNIDVSHHLIIFENFNFIIYTYGGIDFIIIDIDLWNVDYIKINKLSIIIKKYVNKKKYLVKNILYFTNYINDIESHILCILSYTQINITLVTLKPRITIDKYIDICTELKLKTIILPDKNTIDFLQIIKSMYTDDYEYIYKIFIDLIV